MIYCFPSVIHFSISPTIRQGSRSTVAVFAAILRRNLRLRKSCALLRSLFTENLEHCYYMNTLE